MARRSVDLTSGNFPIPNGSADDSALLGGRVSKVVFAGLGGAEAQLADWSLGSSPGPADMIAAGLSGSQLNVIGNGNVTFSHAVHTGGEQVPVDLLSDGSVSLDSLKNFQNSQGGKTIIAAPAEAKKGSKQHWKDSFVKDVESTTTDNVGPAWKTLRKKLEDPKVRDAAADWMLNGDAVYRGRWADSAELSIGYRIYNGVQWVLGDPLPDALSGLTTAELDALATIATELDKNETVSGYEGYYGNARLKKSDKWSPDGGTYNPFKDSYDMPDVSKKDVQKAVSDGLAKGLGIKPDLNQDVNDRLLGITGDDRPPPR